MRTSFALLSTVLKQEFELVKNRTNVKASWEENFGELMQKVGDEFTLKIIDKIVILKSELFSDTHEVAMDASVSICQIFSCSHVCVYFRTKKSKNCSSAMPLFHLSVVFAQVMAESVLL